VSSIVVAALTVLGAAIGSFLNVAGYRLPRGKSILTPGSQCPSCAGPIRWRHNIPVLGWLLLRGRCHDCNSPISLRYPAVEAATAGLYLTAGLMVTHEDAWALLPLLLGTATIAVAVIVVTTGGPRPSRKGGAILDDRPAVRTPDEVEA
jgi:leader peptidase (prepilin peptidase) / N-methyltransferase